MTRIQMQHQLKWLEESNLSINISVTYTALIHTYFLGHPLLVILEILLLRCVCSMYFMLITLRFTVHFSASQCNQAYSSPRWKHFMPAFVLYKLFLIFVENPSFSWGQDIRVLWFCEEETHRTWDFAKNKDSINNPWSSSKTA